MRAPTVLLAWKSLQLLYGSGWAQEPFWSLWRGTGKLPFLPQGLFLSLFVVQYVVSCEDTNVLLLLLLLIIIIIYSQETILLLLLFL